MTTTGPNIFAPSPSVADKIIHDLGDPDLSIRIIAAECETTVEALTLWFTRPDIAARLNNFQMAIQARTRMVAHNFLPSAVKALYAIICEYHLDIQHNDLDYSRKPYANQRARLREAARKASFLLTRLAGFGVNSGVASRPAAAPTQQFSPPTPPVTPSRSAPPSGRPIHPTPPPATPSIPRPAKSSPPCAVPAPCAILASCGMPTALGGPLPPQISSMQLTTLPPQPRHPLFAPPPAPPIPRPSALESTLPAPLTG